MRGYERAYENVEREMVLEKMSKRAEEYLSKQAPSLSIFENYDQDMIRKDQKHVEDLKRKFENEMNPQTLEAKRLANVLEAIAYEYGEQGNWFGGENGEDIETIKTTDYDDIVNGVDMVVEYSQEDNSFAHLGLAVDVTYREDLGEKLTRIKDEVKSGKLSTVKYFHSHELNFKGEMKYLPRVIAGISAEHVRELGELWLNGKKKSLSEHPVQILFLEEIEAQLVSFRELAMKNEDPRTSLALQRSLMAVQRAIKNKKEFMASHRTEIADYKSTDVVYNELMRMIR